MENIRMDIIFVCEKDDDDFKTLIKKTFPDVDEIENYSISGLDEVVQYIIPVTALVLQLADFIFAHFNETDDKERLVIINGKKKVFKGYTKDEIIEILGKLG